MAKLTHEIRDPIHTFIHLDDQERRVIDSPPVQRLRQIHQLATTYLVYPGATHRRFEHSLGVMELASRVFDVVTNEENVAPSIRELISPDLVGDSYRRQYWRHVIRMAALCHDLGHLPFSHAAEGRLLPDGWNHERLTKELVLSPSMSDLWRSMTPNLSPVHIAKLAVGPEYFKDDPFSDVEAILSEIIIGDALGVDRMDYLLRDSYHTGVAYGRFDHFRLIDTLRILRTPSSGEERDSSEPQLGVEQGGLRSAEALLLARYFMFSQVYFHPVRRAYDIHLMDFLLEWLDSGQFSTNLEDFLAMTDAEIISGMSTAARDSSARGHEHAKRIVGRGHFKVLWERNEADLRENPSAGELIYLAAVEKYGEEVVKRDSYSPSSAVDDFPTIRRNGDAESAQSSSQVLQNVPTAAFDYVFIDRVHLLDAIHWLDRNRQSILSLIKEAGDGESSAATAP